MSEIIQQHTVKLRQRRLAQKSFNKRVQNSVFAGTDVVKLVRFATKSFTFTSTRSEMDGIIRSAQLQAPQSSYRSGGWRVSTRVPSKQYEPLLKDVYPRNEYTRMPVHHGPKYFTGHFLTYDFKDAPQVNAADTKSSERPVVFKPQTIERVQTRKKYGENIKGYSSVPLHLCNDTTSFLYQRSLRPNQEEPKRPETNTSSELSDMKSVVSRYPYALHFNMDSGRRKTPVSNYTYTRTWVNTNNPTKDWVKQRPDTTVGTGTPDRASLSCDRDRRLASIRNAPEWYSEFFPRQKVADALKFMGAPKPSNQTGRGKEHDVNFHGK